jgi:hypothetical protein
VGVEAEILVLLVSLAVLVVVGAETVAGVAQEIRLLNLRHKVITVAVQELQSVLVALLAVAGLVPLEELAVMTGLNLLVTAAMGHLILLPVLALYMLVAVVALTLVILEAVLVVTAVLTVAMVLILHVHKHQERQTQALVEGGVLILLLQPAQAAQALSLSNGRKPLKHAQHLHLLVTG